MQSQNNESERKRSKAGKDKKQCKVMREYVGHYFTIGLKRCRSPQRKEGEGIGPPGSLPSPVCHWSRHIPQGIMSLHFQVAASGPSDRADALLSVISSSLGEGGRTRELRCVNQMASGCRKTWVPTEFQHSRSWVGEQLRAWGQSWEPGDRAERSWGGSWEAYDAHVVSQLVRSYLL